MKITVAAWGVAAVFLLGAIAGESVNDRAASSIRHELEAEIGVLKQENASLKADVDSLRRELGFFQRYIRPDSVLIHNQLQAQAYPRRTDAEVDSLTRWLISYGMQVGISPRVLLAVSHVESRFNPLAVSPVGALGIMQVMPQVWWGKFANECGYWRRGDAKANICYGAHILRHYIDTTDGTTRSGLAAYYAGPKRIHRSYAVAYVGLVTQSYQRLTGERLLL